MNKNYLWQFLFNEYENYKWKQFSNRIVTHQQLKKAIKTFSSNPEVKIKSLGKSIDRREVYLIEIGKGSTNVIAWSQMHGDEPTATKSIFDILNFLTSNDEYDDFRKLILSKLKLYFIPMLNPDGAEVFQRENSLQIDLNRDYLSLQSNESSILKETIEKIKPSFAFNLHDQNNYYAVGNSNKTAALSFLAPPPDYNSSISLQRKNAMQIIVKLYEMLSKHIPGHIARYKDDFEPRSFGDNLTKSGLSTILIESGSWINDRSKSLIRKLNFVTLLCAFEIISENEYLTVDHELYFTIPENKESYFDLLLRNLRFTYKGKNYNIDIAINLQESFDAKNKSFYYNGIIKDIGDLSFYYGHEEIDLTNSKIEPGKVYNRIINSKTKLKKEFILRLIKNGFTYIKTSKLFVNEDYTNLPINFLINKNFLPLIKKDQPANLVIYNNKEIRYVVINGFLYDTNQVQLPPINGIIVR
ncbi:M14 family zinc carboxypeptidase [Melioribacteraceae bacterium 4301-Me]|uniref:M14 family zinc carboxypeptidase n=1 Tax=Pyranulibacter aquaticus TaxID=3163344 RepID=UPI003594D0F4